MKKIVSLFLCLLLLCPAFALADGRTILLEEMGIEYQMDLGPVTKYGSAHVAQDGILSHSPYIAGLEYSYALIPPAEMERLSRAGSLTEEEQLRLSTLIVPYVFFVVSDGTAAQVADLVNQLADLGLKETEAVEFGTVEGFHNYYFGLRSRLILQVHDELILECPPEEVERASALLRECMEGVITLKVPLEAEVHTGKNWAEAK